jgi:hypothetical protein
MLRITALLILLPCLALAQTPPAAEPTGMDRLAIKLAQAELDAARYLDEVNSLKKQLATMREMMLKREEKKPEK